MKRIGITGGIGAGKSAASEWLREQGFAVYDTDREAKRLMQESGEIRNALVDRFGELVYKDGKLNRGYLAGFVFVDEASRRFVNGVVHPVVIADFMSWSYATGADVVFVESAILNECNLRDIVDGVIYVDAPEEIRIARTMQRDNATREDVVKRIQSQTDAKGNVTFTVDNSGTFDDLARQMEHLAASEGWKPEDKVKGTVKTASNTEKKSGTFWKKFWAAVGILFALSVVWVVILKWLPIWFTPLMLRRAIEAPLEGRDVHFERKWVSLDEISSKYISACIASEDNLFATHYGFSEKGIKQAWESNKKGGKLRGGSTISQQTAKNVFTFGTRTWFRKGVETYFTVLIELIWGKERIMEVYCNIAELGDGVYGVEAASRKYFHKSAKKLNVEQAALMAAALPSPRRYSISNPGPYMRKRRGQIARLIPKMRKFPPQE
ncbi:MAG: monofunctional biosynthetic peptidoglycan transglycosylase [Paludibacteraceae bacterium]|nr:monofunctional biosynthetic peptidoglycan transglycosylase [Paludibacteraceae bacterium]